MDFKGEVRVRRGWCYPLTVLDDHSRFALGLEACPGPILEPTQAALTKVFRRYGLPHRMTMDNGSPWGSVMHGRAFHTRFAAWLMQLGIIVSHSRPRHPQTQGKDERFHRTLKLEVRADERGRAFRNANVNSIDGAMSTTRSGRMRRSTSTCRPRITH
jgi:transposase InsO family protein